MRGELTRAQARAPLIRLAYLIFLAREWQLSRLVGDLIP